MARLVKLTDTQWLQQKNEDYKAYMDRLDVLLDEANKLSASLDPNKTLVGAIVRFSVADGYAYYRVVKDAPLSVEHLPYMDGYATSAAEIRGLTKKDVIAQISHESFWQKAKDENKAFYANLKVGQIVHYDSSHKAFVRCTVIEQNGEHVLLPIGLVGDWRAYDLPRYDSCGELYLGYWGENIKDGKAFSPHMSNLYEAMKVDRVDPRQMPLISLDPPPMDERAKHLAPANKTINEIRELSNETGYDSVGYLRAVMELCQKTLQEHYS